jgi:hypothetical protein
MFIPDPDPGSESRIRIVIFYPSRFPDPGSKRLRIPNPGSGFATLVLVQVSIGAPLLNIKKKSVFYILTSKIQQKKFAHQVLV